MEIHNKLKEFFKKKGISNKEIATRIGYSETMTGRYLTVNKPNYEFLIAVAREFPDIDLNYLFKSNSLYELNEDSEVYPKNSLTLIDEIEAKLEKLKVNLSQN